jgi:DNA-binding response OmpR family regulator
MIVEAEPLRGARVLIVEDRYLIAAEIANEVSRLGGAVVGPSPTLGAARAALSSEGADLALLDVNLDHEPVYPLAAQLDEAGVPFVFLTGYDADVLPPEWRSRPRLTKPISSRALREELLRLRPGGAA